MADAKFNKKLVAISEIRFNDPAVKKGDPVKKITIKAGDEFVPTSQEQYDNLLERRAARKPPTARQAAAAQDSGTGTASSGPNASGSAG